MAHELWDAYRRRQEEERVREAALTPEQREPLAQRQRATFGAVMGFMAGEQAASAQRAHDKAVREAGASANDAIRDAGKVRSDC